MIISIKKKTLKIENSKKTGEINKQLFTSCGVIREHLKHVIAHVPSCTVYNFEFILNDDWWVLLQVKGSYF